ncbi:DUF177 domain-containing protein [Myxosarcina sp. GI1]|uniref:YceD family protein n=1 Tax=Myxosarcina sp. GI1 TaxID=1541065 RepID=UPI00056CE196|nr:YceD family protein [Myxosarcina sp. GI1]
MQAIYIPNLLKASGRKLEIAIEDRIAEFSTLTPVKGNLVVRHGGNFLEVVAKVETIVTLTCDRCLQSYNYRLAIDNSEIIWLELAGEIEDLPAEREVSTEDLSETLPPNGYFDPESWLYEQLCLATPLRQLCGKECQGTTQTSTASELPVDSRWSSLAALKEQLPRSE